MSSYIHPPYTRYRIDAMNEVQQNTCSDTSFVDRHKISVVYGDCENTNLTRVYNNVYLYPGLFER